MIDLKTDDDSAKHGQSGKLRGSSGYPAEQMHLGYTIRRLREIKGLTQGDLARNAAANLSYISLIENHPSNISIEKIRLICNAMAVGMPLFTRIVEALDDSLVLQKPDP